MAIPNAAFPSDGPAEERGNSRKGKIVFGDRKLLWKADGIKSRPAREEERKQSAL
jgi:hypothetical protein